MTSSFQPNPLPDISQYNYTKTEPDLTESINDNIDALTKDRKNYYDQLIEINNLNIKRDRSELQGILNLIPVGFQAVQDIQRIQEQARIYKDSGYSAKDRQNYLNKLNSDKDETERELLKEAEKDKLKEKRPDLYNAILSMKNADISDKDILVRLLNEFPTWEVASQKLIAKTEDGRKLAWTQVRTPEDWYDFDAYRVGTMLDILLLNGFNPGLIDKYYGIPLHEKKDARFKKWQTKQTQLESNEIVRFKKKDVINELTALGPEKAGTHISSWLKNNYTYFNNSWGEGRSFYFNTITEAVNSGELKLEIAESILRHEEQWRGLKEGQKKSVEDHWPTESSVLKKAISDTRKANIQAKQSQKVADTNVWVSSILDPARSKIQTISPDQRLEFLKGISNSFYTSLGKKYPNIKLPEEFKDWVTRLEDDETEAINIIKNRLSKNLPVPDYLFDPIYTSEGLKKAEGLRDHASKILDPDEQNEIEGRIRASIGGHLTENLLLPGTPQSTDFQQIESHALPAFYAKLRQLMIEEDIPEGVAIGKAFEMFEGETGTKNFNTWKKLGYKSQGEYDPSSAQDLSDTITLLKSDNTKLNSKEIHPGEFDDLQQGYILYKTGEGNFPSRYWKISYSGILDEPKTPHEALTTRLEATGFIKEGKPIPERDRLIPYLQRLLLNKPSSSSTIRTILESDQSDWMIGLLNSIHTDSDITKESLRKQLLDNIYTDNSWISSNNDWFRYNEIDEDLLNDYSEATGDNNIYSSPLNLTKTISIFQVERKLQEESKSFEERIKEAFPEKDVSMLGQPISTEESIEQTGLYKAGVGTRDFIMSFLRDDEGNLNTIGTMLERLLTGEGAEDVEEWIRSAPLGKIIDSLDEFLDPQTLQQIKELTE